MKATQLLHNLGQSIWLDNITRDLLNSGTLKRYIDELSVTGTHLESDDLRSSHQEQRRVRRGDRRRTSKAGNPEKNSSLSWRWRTSLGPPTNSGRFTTRPMEWTVGCRSRYLRLLAYDTGSTLRAAKDLYARANRPNLFIKIPGHEGRHSRDRGSDLRRNSDQRDAPVLARAVHCRRRSLPPGRRAANRCRPQSQRRLGCIDLREPLGRSGRRQSARRLSATGSASPWPCVLIRPIRACSPRRAGSESTMPARVLSACSGRAPEPRTPKASDILYVKALAAPFTVNTMPEGTLKALAEYTELGSILPADGGDCEEVLRAVHRGRNRCRRIGRSASGRGRQVVRQIVERTDGSDRVQERCANSEERSGGVEPTRRTRMQATEGTVRHFGRGKPCVESPRIAL